MAIIARQVLTTARDAHPALDRKSTPDAVALRWLAKHQQALLQEIAQYKRDAVHVPQEITIPLDEFDEGEAIDAHLHVHGGKVVFTDTDRRPIDLVIVEYPLRLVRDGPPYAYIRARQLFLTGAAEDWAHVATITLDLFPAGPDAIAMADELLLPGSPMRGCAPALAEFMAGRVPGGGVTVPAAKGEVQSYLDEVTDRKRAKIAQILEVY